MTKEKPETEHVKTKPAEPKPDKGPQGSSANIGKPGPK